MVAKLPLFYFFKISEKDEVKVVLNSTKRADCESIFSTENYYISV